MKYWRLGECHFEPHNVGVPVDIPSEDSPKCKKWSWNLGDRHLWRIINL